MPDEEIGVYHAEFVEMDVAFVPSVSFSPPTQKM